MKISGTLVELLDLVRSCEYLRSVEGCKGCPFHDAFVTDEFACCGIDDICNMEVEDGNQENS